MSRTAVNCPCCGREICRWGALLPVATQCRSCRSWIRLVGDRYYSWAHWQGLKTLALAILRQTPPAEPSGPVIADGICSRCGCTEDRACVNESGPCWWVDASGRATLGQTQLCSHCFHSASGTGPGPVSGRPYIAVGEPR